MQKKEQIPAYIEMDERDTTERILHNMLDPEKVEQKRRLELEQKRVSLISKRLSI